MHHPKAERQFAADLEALECADTCVLVLPCCRSAHTEAGWMAGAGKRVIAYIPEMVEPELKLRHSLWHLGFRYRVNDKRLPGSPDIVLPKYRTVISSTVVSGTATGTASSIRFPRPIPSSGQRRSHGIRSGIKRCGVN